MTLKTGRFLTMGADKKEIIPEKIKNILIRVPNWLGDAVLAIPALDEIRYYFKHARITLLAPDFILELFKENQVADQYLVLDPDKNHHGIIGKWRLIREIKEKQFDMAILLQNAFEIGFISFLSSIPIRYGYSTDGRGFLLTHRIPCSKNKKQHQLLYYLELIRPLIGPDLKESRPVLNLTGEEKTSALLFLEKEEIQSHERIIGIHAGAAYGSAKRWPMERFARLCDRLILEEGAKIIFFGSSGEIPLVNQIENQMSQKVINLAGKTGIRDLLSLISVCRIFITNDSGPMHIASALGVPVLSIFGPTDWETTSPVGEFSRVIRHPVECSPCLLRDCPIDHPCMTGITVEEVLKAAREPFLFSRVSSSSSSPAVFLDRDGTLNEDTHYVSNEENFHIFPETPMAISLFNQADIPVFVVSNQSGVERGYFTGDTLLKLQQKLEVCLKRFHAIISGFYYCPHRPETQCACRKPQTGLIQQILEQNWIDLKKSYCVGDKMCDLELAGRIGSKGILVLTGKGKETLKNLEESNGIKPFYIARNILDAARWILSDLKKGPN